MRVDCGMAKNVEEACEGRVGHPAKKITPPCPSGGARMAQIGSYVAEVGLCGCSGTAGATVCGTLLPYGGRAFLACNACHRGHLEVAKWMVARFELTGEDVRDRAFYLARKYGHKEVVAWLESIFDL